MKRKSTFSGRVALRGCCGCIVAGPPRRPPPPWAGPAQRAIGTRRSPAGGDRSHQHDAGKKASNLPASASRRRRAYRAANVDYNPVLPSTKAVLGEARRRPPVRPSHERSRRAGAVRRRDPRDLVGHRTSGARIHARCSIRRSRRVRTRRAHRRRRRWPPPRRPYTAPIIRSAPAPMPSATPSPTRAERRAAYVRPPPMPRRRSRRRRRSNPTAQSPTTIASGRATRSRASPLARSAPACRSTRCWSRCSGQSPRLIDNNMNRLKSGVVLSVPRPRRRRRCRRRKRGRSSRLKVRTSALTANVSPVRRLLRQGRRQRAPGQRQGPGLGRRPQAEHRPDARQAHAEQGRRPDKTARRRTDLAGPRPRRPTTRGLRSCPRTSTS